jgi:hypothetical protein
MRLLCKDICPSCGSREVEVEGELPPEGMRPPGLWETPTEWHRSCKKCQSIWGLMGGLFPCSYHNSGQEVRALMKNGKSELEIRKKAASDKHEEQLKRVEDLQSVRDALTDEDGRVELRVVKMEPAESIPMTLETTSLEAKRKECEKAAMEAVLNCPISIQDFVVEVSPSLVHWRQLLAGPASGMSLGDYLEWVAANWPHVFSIVGHNSGNKDAPICVTLRTKHEMHTRGGP